MSKCTCTMQALPNDGIRLIQCPSCAAMDRDSMNCELDALRARVAELEQAFRHYAVHDENCPAYSYVDMPCGCGYREILRTL